MKKQTRKEIVEKYNKIIEKSRKECEEIMRKTEIELRRILR